MISSPGLSETNSPENLSLFLERLPHGRYDYYVESKNLYGYNEDLMVELKLVLKEFQETEKEKDSPYIPQAYPCQLKYTQANGRQVVS